MLATAKALAVLWPSLLLLPTAVHIAVQLPAFFETTWTAYEDLAVTGA